MVFLLPLRCVLFILIFAAGILITGKKLEEISFWWSLVASLVNGITILILCLWSRKNGSGYADLINYRKGETKAGQVIGITFLILGAGMGGMYLAGFLCYHVIPYAAPMMIAPVPVPLAAVNFFVLPVTTAFAEDGLYLGAGVNQIENKWAAIFIPAFFFALQHSFIPTLFDFRYIIYRFISFLPLTVILCWYYQKKRNPLPVMIGHGIIDLATAAQIMATSAIPGFYDMMCGL